MVLFLLNKVVSLAEFVPFVTDFAAVVILVLAAVVWSALFYSVLGEKVPTAGYAFFGAVFLSSPLISEVFTYFLHNGIAIGYLCCGISLCCVREWQSSTRKMQKGSGIRQKLGCLAVAKILTAAVFLWIVHGMLRVLYDPVAGGADALAADGADRTGTSGEGHICHTGAGAVAALVAIVLRSVMIVVVTKAFHLGISAGRGGTAFRDGNAGLDAAAGGFRGACHDPQEDLCAVWGICLCLSADPDFYIISGCDPCGDAGAGDPRQRSVGTSVVACRLFGSIFSSVH